MPVQRAHSPWHSRSTLRDLSAQRRMSNYRGTAATAAPWDKRMTQVPKGTTTLPSLRHQAASASQYVARKTAYTARSALRSLGFPARTSGIGPRLASNGCALFWYGFSVSFGTSSGFWLRARLGFFGSLGPRIAAGLVISSSPSPYAALVDFEGVYEWAIGLGPGRFSRS